MKARTTHHMFTTAKLILETQNIYKPCNKSKLLLVYMCAKQVKSRKGDAGWPWEFH